MLELIGVSHQIKLGKEESRVILDHITFTAPASHTMAVLGAKGSGKTSLLKVIAGQTPAALGTMAWQGTDIGSRRIAVNDAGFVPVNDDVLHETLTVQENIISAMLLRVAALSQKDALDRAAHLMVVTGIETIAGYRVALLSKAQRRRLKLAIALVSQPSLVLCDDFTEGLDAKSERELVALLQMVARDHPGRLVINATANPANLGHYDSTLLIHDGCACFHGPARALCHYFSAKQTEEIFPRLAKRPAKRWSESWNKHRDSYYAAFDLGQDGGTLSAAEGEEASENADGPEQDGEATGSWKKGAGIPAALPVPPLPALGTQITHLIKRRWSVFGRSKSQWLTHVLMLVGLPLVGALFCGRSKELLTGDLSGPVLPVAYAVAMTILLQVIFVILMAVQNGSREIASERGVYERERGAGLRPVAYLVSKIVFVACLFLAQGAWFTLFLDMVIGKLPGPPMTRLLLLLLTGAAFSMLCLGISACVRSAERASSVCLMLAFLQIPFSGALLALPNFLGILIHPLATSYAGWSGTMDSMPGPLIGALNQINGTWFAAPGKAAVILGVHALIGLVLCAAGLARRR
jgi:ABC-type multidrug transport system ATPase subunit